MLVSWSVGLWSVTDLGCFLRFAACGCFSCVLVRCWVLALVSGLWCGVVVPGGAWWCVVVWWSSVVWGPVAGGRPLCVRCEEVWALVPWMWFVGCLPILVCR